MLVNHKQGPSSWQIHRACGDAFAYITPKPLCDLPRAFPGCALNLRIFVDLGLTYQNTREKASSPPKHTCDLNARCSYDSGFHFATSLYCKLPCLCLFEPPPRPSVHRRPFYLWYLKAPRAATVEATPLPALVLALKKGGVRVDDLQVYLRNVIARGGHSPCVNITVLRYTVSPIHY